MDKFELRRAALRALVQGLNDPKTKRGGIKRVADAIEREANYISRCLYEPRKKGHKKIGEDIVDLLNEKFPNWLRGTSDEAPQELHVSEPQVLEYFTSLPIKKQRAIIHKLEAISLEAQLQAESPPPTSAKIPRRRSGTGP